MDRSSGTASVQLPVRSNNISNGGSNNANNTEELTTAHLVSSSTNVATPIRTPSNSSLTLQNSLSLNLSHSSNTIGGYQPLCFSKDVFTNEEFKVDVFVQDCKRRVALESVLNDLKEYSHSLDNELLELINKDYADFVNLSSNLVGIDKVLNELRKPLHNMKDEIVSIKGGLEESIRRIENKLLERRDLFDKRATLELFINVSISISKIEKLLLIPGSNEEQKKHGTDQSVSIILKGDEGSSNLIERVASEFNHLKYYVTKGKNFPFVKNMEPRIIYIENTLQTGLERLFKEGLTTKNDNIVDNCLRTYAAIDKMSEAENLYRKWFLQPFTSKIITIEYLDSHSDGLSRICKDICLFIEKDCFYLLNMTQKYVRGYNFLANSIFADIADSIFSRIPKIFSAAFPDTFHQNYQTSMKFLEQIEGYCSSKSELNGLRNHPSFSEFIKRWNLSIYFQLRFQKIANEFESKLTLQNQFAEQIVPNEFNVEGTKGLWDSLFKCWNENTFLQPLAHRFLKLSFQLLYRYKSWIISALDLLSIPNTPSVPNDPSAPSTPQTKPANGTPSTPSSTEQSDINNHILKSITNNQWVYLYHDVSLLSSKIISEYLPFVNEVLNQSNFSSSLESSYVECTKELQKVLNSIEVHITDHIIGKCFENAQPAQGIPATYRFTSKPVSTKPSFFVANISVPIDDLLKHSDKLIRDDIKHSWTLKIVSEFTNKYRDFLVNILVSYIKSMAYLKKLGKNKQDKSSNQGMSDTDRICVQMFLDIEAWGNDLKLKYHIDLDNFEPFKQLEISVTKAKETAD